MFKGGSLIFVFAATFHFFSPGADYGYTSSTVSQTAYSGTVMAGDNNVIMLQVAVTISKISNGGPCNPAIVTSVTFSTAGTPGTTNPADLAMARLWYTGTVSTYSSPVLKGTMAFPSGVFAFPVSEIYCTEGTYYYWLTYDIASNAQPGNLVDASIPALGISVTQPQGNPAYTPSFNDPGYSRNIVCPPVIAPPTPPLPPMSQFLRPTFGTHNANTGVSIALSNDGTVWGSGSDQNGEMGDGLVGNPNTTGNSWVQVPPAYLNNVAQVSLGWNTAMALKYDGTVWGWGDNWYGKTGMGVQSSVVTPPAQTILAAGGPLTNVVKVLAAYYITAAMTADHKIYAWGRNSGGAFGAPHAANSDFHSAVLIYDGGQPLNWAVDFGPGDSHMSYIRWDGTVWSVGNGQFGQLGNSLVYGPGGGSSVPTAALAPGGCMPLSGIVKIAVSRRFTLALDASGNVYGWGLNNYAQTGTGAGPNVYTPKRVLGPNCTGYLTNIVDIGATGDNGYAIAANGNLYAWGSDQEGMLGDGSPPDTTSSCPKLVDTDVVEVQGSLYSVLLKKTTGCLYGAGNNWFGQLGGPTPGSCCGFVREFKLSNLFFWCQVPLPVTLAGFRAEQQGNRIQVKWTTHSEENNDYFIVEKRLQSGDFAPLGKVAGHGTTGATHHYGIDDRAPWPGSNYYRLVQVDFSGTRNTSDPIVAKFESTSRISLHCYLTDGDHAMVIIYSSDRTDCLLEVTDLAGHVAARSSFYLKEGENVQEMAIRHLNGIYTLRLRTNDDTAAIKVCF